MSRFCTWFLFISTAWAIVPASMLFFRVFMGYCPDLEAWCELYLKMLTGHQDNFTSTEVFEV